MDKTLFLSILFFYLFFSCTKKDNNTSRKSTGKINTISVIIDNQLWKGEIGDSIRNKFAVPVVGLPQEEPLFTINQYPTKLMEGFMTDSRTIIVVKKDNINKFEIQKNQYASPQNVFHISGKTADDILKILETHTSEIIKIIKETEIFENQRIINLSLIDTKKITSQFHISIKVPSGYLYVLQKDNFVWLKKEIVSGNLSLLIYQIPINSLQKNTSLVASIVKFRDSIGGMYIQGVEPESKMITEEGYAPYFSKIMLHGRKAYETKGTWELKNDFMSGPFINYAIVDEQHNRILVLEGFCYSPSKEERDFMHELESIIKSIKFLK